eukprot:TRINITY_DN1875_c0_g1_i1.p1 TRINITY_DN1875_c0_g1~~TRINITY_DN1875_c0_g1_i1.p1  ORF type:complete len:141 (+),score=23.78 TRINITY_DN1875_c0_g1_i1:831-1253(+)
MSHLVQMQSQVLGTQTNFKFAEPVDLSSSENPKYVWPEFNLVEPVFKFEVFGFPIELEIILGVNITFLGNQNDGSSGNGNSKHDLLEMIDNTRYLAVEVKRRYMLFPSGRFHEIAGENQHTTEGLNTSGASVRATKSVDF